MTVRIPMFLAASLVLASHAAYASSTPTNTDEIRARIASRQTSSPLLTAAPNVVATSTDEVRAIVAGLEPTSTRARSAGTANVISTNTDEVRAIAARMLP
jgi:hypothetical protein